MGVDILIVVDVGTPLLKRDKLNSVPVISNQMLAILIQHNSQGQLEKLTPQDVLIEPPLGDTSSFDFGNRQAGDRGGRERRARLGRAWRRLPVTRRKSQLHAKRVRLPPGSRHRASISCRSIGLADVIPSDSIACSRMSSASRWIRMRWRAT